MAEGRLSGLFWEAVDRLASRLSGTFYWVGSQQIALFTF